MKRSRVLTSPLTGFNFTLHVRDLCADFIARLDELQHIDLDRVAIGFNQARKAVMHGVHASLTPLRFETGALFMTRRGRRWTIQRLYDSSGREMLYILNFRLPRFLNCPLKEKLNTVVHELWHIGPQFDGDLRRHPGRCYAHSGSKKNYDAAMDTLVEKWLSLGPPESVYGFLRCSFRELAQRHGCIVGQRIPTPRLLRVPAGTA